MVDAEDATLIEINPLIVTNDRRVVALDSKATIDGNALFRHPELAELTDKSAEDPQEAMAKEKGLTYVKLGGNIGILGNGAGLCMSTLDVVAQAGGKPANFLDAGGGSKADAIVDALEVITSDRNVNAILFNIFGGITRVRRDRQGDHRGLRAGSRSRCRWSSASTAPTRPRASGSSPRPSSATCTSSRRCSARRRPWSNWPAALHEHHRRRRHEARRFSGLTGREGTFHGLRNRDYGTDLVAGVTPGKGGQDVDGVPVFDSIREAVDERGANTSMIFVPARFAAAAIEEAIDAGVETVIAITEGIPVLDMMRVYWRAQDAGHATRRARTARACSRRARRTSGSSRRSSSTRGSIGVVSKSGTLTYQIGNELKQAGVGNSSIVGIGGDPIIGSDFIDVLELYENDPETELVVMVGEIGGDAEERAAEYIAESMSKPVVAYIAGFTAPPGKQMGHAGAIISGSSGTARREEASARGQGRTRRQEPDRDRADRGRGARRSRCARATPGAGSEQRCSQGSYTPAAAAITVPSSSSPRPSPRPSRRSATPRPGPSRLRPRS